MIVQIHGLLQASAISVAHHSACLPAVSAEIITDFFYSISIFFFSYDVF
jgi:hypothetical protein